MKKFQVLVMLLSFVAILGCAEMDQNLRNDSSNRTYPARMDPISQQTVEVIKYKDREVVKEVVPKDAIRVKNLTWETSDNLKEVSTDSKSGRIFDLGVGFQMGFVDALSDRKFSKEERIQIYPLFREYQKRGEVSFVDVNVAYEGGYAMGIKVKTGVPESKPAEKKK